MLNKILIFALLSAGIILFNSCDLNSPGLENYLNFELEDVTCSEAWFSISGDTRFLNDEYEVLVNGKTKKRFILEKLPYTLFLDKLGPYEDYQVELRNNSNKLPKFLAFRTDDTTSHNITWEEITIGNPGSKVYDIQVLNDTIYAVGNFYINNESQPYGLATWDGIEWNYKRIRVPGLIFDSAYVLPTGILVFNSNDIWYAGRGVFHWDGEGYKTHWLTSLRAEDEDVMDLISIKYNRIYCRTSKGGILYHNRVNWSRIPTGTSNFLSDFWFVDDFDQENKMIYIIASDLNRKSNQLLKMNTLHEITSEEWYASSYLSAGWSNNNLIYFLGGDSLYIKKSNKIEFSGTELRNVPAKISGTDYNNVYIVGLNGMLIHFNGVSYHQYEQIPNSFLLNSIEFENNKVYIGGADLNTYTGKILIGSN